VRSGRIIALKAWALVDRNKSKDGYDVVWLLKAYGPDRLAARFKEKGLAETDFGKQALTRLEKCFMTHEHTGPVGWADESMFEGEERAVELREAEGVVKEFLRAAREAK
jgi:hypothetical protein